MPKLPDYIIQKAVEHDAIQKKLRKPLDFCKANYILQPKYDGCCAIVATYPGGGFTVYTRTGEKIRSMDHIGKALVCEQPHGVFIGEAYVRKTEQSLISGLVRQHSDAPELEFVVNDVLTLSEFTEGFSGIAYWQRMARWVGVWPYTQTRPASFATTFGPGPMDPDELLAELMLDQGYDGIILRDPEGTWTAGSGTTGEIIKVKPTYTFDLEIVGYKEGLGKDAGSVGALQFRWRNDTTVWARGGTTTEKTAWLKDPSLIMGKIGEVEAMGLSSGGLLREPRFKGLRFDKLQADA